MIKIKQIILIIPVLIISIVLIKLYSEKKIQSYEKSLQQKYKTTQLDTTRAISSQEVTNNLVISLRKINEHQKNENPKTHETGHSLVDFQKADADLNYFKDHFFSKDKKVDLKKTQQQAQEIQLRVSENKKLYNERLHIKLEDSLLNSDDMLTTQLFALAASVPLGTSSIQYSAEKILMEMAAMDRTWNEDMFRNALQFYYIQSFIKNEQSDTLKDYFLEKCPDEQLRKKILEIDKEINNYAISKEDER